MTREWTLPEVCPACGANGKQEGNMCLLYECGTIVYTDGHVAVSMECQANQLADYKCVLEMVCDPDEVDRRLAAARAARLGGE